MIINEAWRKENRRLSTVIYGGVMIACVTWVGTISGYISRYMLKEFHFFFDDLTVVHKMLGGKNDSVYQVWGNDMWIPIISCVHL